MIAELASGHRDVADVLFLIAAVAAAVAAVVGWSAATIHHSAIAAAVCLLAIAWLIL